MTRTSRFAVEGGKCSPPQHPPGRWGRVGLLVASFLVARAPSTEATPARPSEATALSSRPREAPRVHAVAAPRAARDRADTPWPRLPAAAARDNHRGQSQRRHWVAPTELAAVSEGERAEQREIQRLKKVGFALRMSSIGSVLAAGAAFTAGLVWLLEADFTLAFPDDKTSLTEEELRSRSRAISKARLGLGFVGAGAVLTLSSLVLLSVGFHYDGKARERARPRGWRWAVMPHFGGKGGGLSLLGRF